MRTRLNAVAGLKVNWPSSRTVRWQGFRSPGRIVSAAPISAAGIKWPRRWLVRDIGRFMLCIGPISSLFDLATFALLYYYTSPGVE